MVKRELSGHTRYSTASASIESPPASGVETAESGPLGRLADEGLVDELAVGVGPGGLAVRDPFSLLVSFTRIIFEALGPGTERGKWGLMYLVGRGVGKGAELLGEVEVHGVAVEARARAQL